jgi:DNA-directed RNA polymerase subunit beta'
MLKTTLGALMVNESLPEDLRDYNRVLDGPGIKKLFQEVAERHPEQYRDVAKRLSDIGRDVAYATGGFSTSLEDMRPSQAGQRIKEQIRRQVQLIQADGRMSDDQKEQAIVAAVEKRQKEMEDTVFDEAKATGNPFARQVLSGARGSKLNLKTLLGGDLLYADHNDRPIPVPVLNPYPHGLSPVEYWAGAFGARKGVAATKFSTQEAGFLAKQLNQINHRLIVTDHDGHDGHDGPDGHDDESALRGLPVAADDPDNEGALLARTAGPYRRNTVLTPKVLKDIQAQGIEHLLVRSPMIGGPPQGGVYARDVGIRERGGLPPLGDYVGLAASQALSEKLSQGQLSARHTGGVAGADKAVSGFAHINQLIQVPKTFRSGATHAQLDGKITSVADAPQGGKYITIGQEQHYVLPGQTPNVKTGDSVEAGDILSDGIPNPAEIVRHKGIGEGRRYFVGAFRDAYRNSGMSSHRRNIELLARGLIDHVRVTDEFGDHVEDDVVPYSSIEHSWIPREGSRVVGLPSAVGKYLERPVLHHSIGTRIRPGMLPELKRFGVNNLEVHDQPPPFEPEMIRGMYNLQYDPDFMTRHLGSGLEKATLHAAHRGAGSDIAGTSYVPALAERAHFGRQGLTRGWDPGDEPWGVDSDDLTGDDTAPVPPKAPAGNRLATWRGT